MSGQLKRLQEGLPIISKERDSGALAAAKRSRHFAPVGMTGFARQPLLVRTAPTLCEITIACMVVRSPTYSSWSAARSICVHPPMHDPGIRHESNTYDSLSVCVGARLCRDSSSGDPAGAVDSAARHQTTEAPQAAQGRETTQEPQGLIQQLAGQRPSRNDQTKRTSIHVFRNHQNTYSREGLRLHHV